MPRWNAAITSSCSFPRINRTIRFPKRSASTSRAGIRTLRGDGSPDIEELESLVRPETRAIVLTTPNNPTGYAFERAQIEAVVAIARRHGLWLFSDEVYRGTEREAERIPAICDLYERGVSLGGLSKAYGLAGLRIGWIATRDVSLRDRMAALKDYSSICNAAPSEFLAALALRHSERLIERVRRITEQNLERLDEFFARRERLFEWRRPHAGTTAFPRYLRGSSDVFCRELVERAGVLLLPGALFDAGDDYVRFGYGRANLPEALGALDAFIEKEVLIVRVLIVGANGTIGKAVAAELSQRHEIVTAGRSSGDFASTSPIRRASRNVRTHRTARRRRLRGGERSFRAARVDDSRAVRPRPARQADGPSQSRPGGTQFVETGGSFTLISGILAQDPIRLGRRRIDGQRRDRKFRARGGDRASSHRVNAVSPTVLEESMENYAPYFRGFEAVAVHRVALAYSKSVEGAQTGQIYRIRVTGRRGNAA